MEFLQKVLHDQILQLAVLMITGLAFGLAEMKFPARDNKAYRDYRTEALAITVLFFESCSFVFLTEYLRFLPQLQPIQVAINALPWFVLIVGTSVISDLVNYGSHRLLHTEHFWRFHRWHHSPDQLFWFSGFRGSFIHIFLFGFKSILLLSISNLNPWVIGVLAVQGLSAQMLGHTNLVLRIPILSKIMVMPQYHRIHHAIDRRLHDSNYSFVWTFWDKIFGTQTPPESVESEFKIGIPPSEKVSLIRMMIG